MVQNKKFLKLKNILDANYQKYLNYLNISAISLITSIFSMVIGYLSRTIPYEAIFSITILLILVFGSTLIFSYTKMNKALKEMKEI